MAKWLIISSCVLGFLSSGTLAQQQRELPAQSAADVLSTVKKGAGEIEQLRATLRGPDASARVAAFSAMVESNNPALVTIAINEGHVSSDAVLRDLAVRAAFRELKGFTPEPVAKLSAEAQANYLKFSAVRVEINEYQWARGTFKGMGTGSHGIVGQVSAGQLAFASQICQATLIAIEGTWAFEGTVNCSVNNQALRERMRVQIR